MAWEKSVTINSPGVTADSPELLTSRHLVGLLLVLLWLAFQTAAVAAFLQRYHAVLNAFDADMATSESWFAGKFPRLKGHLMAYFSAEFGLHGSLPVYAGGLGILAGDHVKEASDLGLPLLGVAFMYPEGYVRQRLSVDGRQEDVYERLNWAETALEPACMQEKGSIA